MIRARTKSVDETRALGGALAGLFAAGDIVLLAGDLGAGKTALTQGIGTQLGVEEPVTSPTFILARSYDGPSLRLHHLDVYRLEHLQEAIDLGLPEIIDDRAVTVIEWGDVVVPALPHEFLEVRLAFGEDDDERVLELRTVGERWIRRARALEEALSAWSDGPC